MESEAFTLVCEHLIQNTGLEPPAARGTVRLALKEAGLDAASVSAGQMRVVVTKLLPVELRSLRIADVEGHCHTLEGRLARLAKSGSRTDDTPERVFERIGRS
ncbi:MAG: hypothetical protein HKP30_09785 [Myxococcales bacterium]|nr:hypothetical protein [Myxococcales bacterium]